MTTQTARKTSLENKHFRNGDYFAIIPSYSHLQCGRRTLQLDWSVRLEIKYRKLKIYGCMLKLSSKR